MIGICGNGTYAMMSWMGAWALVGVAVVVLAVLGAVWLVHRTSGGGHERSLRETPEEVLRQRFAAGELDEDEYRQRHAGLSE